MLVLFCLSSGDGPHVSGLCLAGALHRRILEEGTKHASKTTGSWHLCKAHMLSSAQEVEEPHCSKGVQQQLLSQHAPDVLGQLHEAVKDKCGSLICVTGCVCSLACAECLQSRLQAKPMLHMHGIDVKSSAIHWCIDN